MESILISIRPEWVAKILNGKKTIEIRKTYPTKIETPFKCYIYCTQGKELWGDGTGTTWQGIDPDEDMDEVFRLNPTLTQLNGKVIGEFVCDKIDTYISEFYIPAQSNVKYIGKVYEDICKIHIDEDGTKEFLIETSNKCSNPNDCMFCKNTCLSFDEIKTYLGNGYTYFYGWHISDLKIYDEPKYLGTFFVKGECLGEDCEGCNNFYRGRGWLDGSYCDESDCMDYSIKPLTRPPQSWCYVKEMEEY